MQYTLIFALLPAIVFAVHPDRHVRTAQGGEQLSIAVQSDGGIVKVEDGKELNLPSAKTREEIEEINKKLQKGNDNLKKAQKHAMGEDEDKKLEEIPKVEPTIPKLEPHIPKEHEDEKKLESIPKIEPKPKEEEMEALVKEAKPHAEAFAAPAGAHEVKLHETREAAPSHPSLAKRKKKVGEGVAMLEVDEPEESGESWKSAFFFFGSLVLFVVLAMALIGFFYFNRDQAEKTGAADSVGLKATPSSQACLNESSSTSDSGEKIAMLFDRVRQSLEDLSDKAPAAQSDVAGGHQNQI